MQDFGLRGWDSKFLNLKTPKRCPGAILGTIVPLFTDFQKISRSTRLSPRFSEFAPRSSEFAPSPRSSKLIHGAQLCTRGTIKYPRGAAKCVHGDSKLRNFSVELRARFVALLICSSAPVWSYLKLQNMLFAWYFAPQKVHAKRKLKSLRCRF